MVCIIVFTSARVAPSSVPIMLHLTPEWRGAKNVGKGTVRANAAVEATERQCSELMSRSLRL